MPGPIITSEIISEDSPEHDLDLAKSLGFNPVEFVDLEGDKSAKVTTNKSDDMPMVIKAPPLSAAPDKSDDAPELIDITIPETPKTKVETITNADAIQNIRYATISIKEHGKKPYIENINTSKFAPPWERFNNLCGQVPYEGADRDIFVRPLTYREGIPLGNALRSRSETSMIDVLSKLVSIEDYRNTAIADHIHFLYYNLLSTTKAEPTTITWQSSIYETQCQTLVHDFEINIHYLQIEPQRYQEFVAKGFTIPRVRDLEINALIEAAQLDEDMQNNIAYLLDRIPYIDIRHSDVQKFIEAAKDKFINPNFHGRVEYLLNQPMSKFEDSLEDFKTALGDFGVIENFKSNAPFKAGEAITILEAITDRNAIQDEELNRARNSVETNSEFKAREEVQGLNRRPWSFFPYV